MEFLTALLCNIGSLAAFTILALHFDKWWIILFAIFFQKNAVSRSNDDNSNSSSNNDPDNENLTEE